MEISRKKIIIVSVFSVLFFLAILAASDSLLIPKGDIFFGAAGSDNKGPLTNKEKGYSDKNSDTDNDGLADSIEDILGTDKSQADTDKDSYGDWEEIKNGYSPVIAGAAGKLSAEEFAALKEKIKNADREIYEKIFSGARDNSDVPASSAASPDMIATPQKLSGPAVFKKEVFLSNKNWKYSFYAPADIDFNKEQALIIGLHGFEGKAEDYIEFWRSDADKNGFLIAMLQAYPKKYPNGSIIESYPWLEISDFAKAVVADIKNKYKLDDKKIFLTGYSAGASSTYIIALDSGIKFKGVIPVDGYLPLEAGIIDKLSKARDVNFYVVHGANDAEIEETVKQEKILLQYGAKMEFKILPDTGHEYPAAEHENIIKWMNGLR